MVSGKGQSTQTRKPGCTTPTKKQKGNSHIKYNMKMVGKKPSRPCSTKASWKGSTVCPGEWTFAGTSKNTPRKGKKRFEFKKNDLNKTVRFTSMMNEMNSSMSRPGQGRTGSLLGKKSYMKKPWKLSGFRTTKNSVASNRNTQTILNELIQQASQHDISRKREGSKSKWKPSARWTKRKKQ